MRLLNVHSLQFREFLAGGVPKYAIASHRWSLGEEITYKDVLKGRNTDKAGYSKVVQFAGFVRAHIPAVEWLWIDTACIDSKSSQEVSEAVNRMFSWYRNAEICLAYLLDVSATDENAFVQSEWFQRGWCLQELLAPRTVVFLTRDWDVIGHKGGQDGISHDIAFDLGPVLDTAISLRTSIPEGVLRSYELSKRLSVSQKLVWMSDRQTTREEDMSYSLLGLLDVAMPTIYGEGGDKARRRLLRELTESSDDPFASISSSRAMTQTAPLPPDPKVVQQRLLDSLRFPGFESRRDQVRVAYHGTYRWTLLSTQTTEVTWDNLVIWLSDPAPRHNMYWISSKPGAGKSSLIRLLDEELRPQDHMQPWSQDMRVVKLHFYFWNPGTDLQRNMAGLMRTLLYQLYDNLPELLTNTIPERKIKIAQITAEQEISWNDHELRACLRTALDAASSSAKLLFLIDGLDEIDGDEDSRDELVDLIREIGRNQNSKLILSSRRWTVFQDAFGMCPQLHLEDLNSRDIEVFVRGQFREQYRFQQMQTYESTVAERLVLDVVRKAEGVFLWARLVMKALVRGLRDGDSEQMLQNKLLSMPGDLNQYFGSLVDSIEPHHRWEACVLLQLALHQEREFVTLSPLRLIDLIFIEDANQNFVLDSDILEKYFNTFSSAEHLHYRLESTLRRLASRCKGLLECYFRSGDPADDEDDDEGFYESAIGLEEIESAPLATTGAAISTLHPVIGQRLFANKKNVYDFRIDFMHRSLREYLQEPSVEQFLWSHTNGEFDARNYLRNARMAQVLMNMSAGLSGRFSLGLASYHISTLSLPGYRETAQCASFVQKFSTIVPYLLAGLDGGARYWYICRSLETFFYEDSTFVTLAIDFALTGYLNQVLTAEMVQTKKGRPLLDYVLRPRFGGAAMEHTIGNQHPDPDLIKRLIQFGADPNQDNEGISLWPLFLSFCRTTCNFNHFSNEASALYISSMNILIRAGAQLSLTTSALSAKSDHGLFYGWNINPTMDQHHTPHQTPEEQRFRARWGSLGETENGGIRESVDLKEVLDALLPALGDGIVELKLLVEQIRGGYIVAEGGS